MIHEQLQHHYNNVPICLVLQGGQMQGGSLQAAPQDKVAAAKPLPPSQSFSCS